MARNYPANTQIQMFLEESYNKEQNMRLSRFFKNREQGNEVKKSKQFEVFKKKVEAAAPRPTGTLAQLRNVKPKSYHRKASNLNDFPPIKSAVAREELVNDMRPVSPTTRSMLYDGFTKEGKGRYQYLQTRYNAEPEWKYRFPVLSSWEYGWCLRDSSSIDAPAEENADSFSSSYRKPAFGRTRIVADTFYTRTGIPALGLSATC